MYIGKKQHPMGETGEKSFEIVTQRVEKSPFSSKGTIWLWTMIVLAWNWGLRNELSLKFVSKELKFIQNLRKFGLKMQNLSKSRSGVFGAGKGLEMVGF